ncbi:MAG: FAD-dependent oxidoreductase [Candidatus Eisenbacteria bacterium]|nr:FAD-dependent oxidoreductase [Candidatus Eisenbacteria bacterium]
MENYDVIVAGAGSVGLPSACYLADKGLSVCVIEKEPSVGQGQNKAAIGGARATHSDPAKIRLCQESLKVFSSWKDDRGEDVGWKKGGYCFPVYRESEEKTLKGILPVQKKFDLNIDWVDPATIKRLIPGVNPNELRGGTYSPDDGQVSPLLVASSYYRLCVSKGVKFAFQEEIVEVTQSRGKIKAIRTNMNDYSSGILLNAAGARARELGKLCGQDIPVVPDSHEGGISAPVQMFLEPLVVDMRPGSDGKSSNFYFGQTSEGQIIFCYTPADPFVGGERRSLSEFMPSVGRRLVELMPRLRNLLVRRCWRGLYPMTPDGNPIIGKVAEPEGLFLAVGACGQGLMMGPGVGRNIAELISTGRPLMEEEIFERMSVHRDFSAAKAEALR